MNQEDADDLLKVIYEWADKKNYGLNDILKFMTIFTVYSFATEKDLEGFFQVHLKAMESHFNSLKNK